MVIIPDIHKKIRRKFNKSTGYDEELEFSKFNSLENRILQAQDVKGINISTSKTNLNTFGNMYMFSVLTPTQLSPNSASSTLQRNAQRTGANNNVNTASFSQVGYFTSNVDLPRVANTKRQVENITNGNRGDTYNDGATLYSVETQEGEGLETKYTPIAKQSFKQRQTKGKRPNPVANQRDKQETTKNVITDDAQDGAGSKHKYLLSGVVYPEKRTVTGSTIFTLNKNGVGDVGGQDKHSRIGIEWASVMGKSYKDYHSRYLVNYSIQKRNKWGVTLLAGNSKKELFGVTGLYRKAFGSNAYGDNINNQEIVIGGEVYLGMRETIGASKLH